MTANELINFLENMPKDALIILRHDLVGNEHEVVAVEYNERSNKATIREIY